jgi:hypothetical protein
MSEYPLLTHAAMTMVLVDPAVTLADLPGIVDVLADDIANELGELTWVLHVVWDLGTMTALPAPGTPPSEIRVPTATPDIGQFVHDKLVEFCDSWGIAFDQVLIETSGINPTGSLDAEMWWAMDGLDCGASVDYIIDDPQQWADLPVTLGLLPATVSALPVALLGELPEAHLVRTLLVELVQIITASNPVQEAEQWWQDAIATQRFRRWARRFIVVVSQIYGSTRYMPQAWPIEAVRVRFEGNPSITTPPNETNEASYQRWGRALTGRRVGVALGGSGAQSYVALPFIEQVLDAGVPIDILSGSSTGTFAAAFYAALGERGLTRMLFNAGTIGLGVFMAYVSNIPLTWWMSWGTNFVDLSETGQPVISVSSVANTGEPWYQTAGLAGKGMMASGSLPPFVATYIGNTRLLDGGLTDDLPTAMLQTAGAELVLAVQAIPKVADIPILPDQIPIPYVTKWAISFNPFVRMVDFLRGYVMVFRQAAIGSEQYAQVSYGATTTNSTVGSWYAGPRIAYEAANSVALQTAVAQAKAHWQAMLAGAPGRVRINLGTKEVEIGSALTIGFELDGSSTLWRLSDDSEAVLAEVGKFVAAHSGTLEVTLVDVPPPTPTEYEPLFATATGLLPTSITYLTATAVGGSPTFRLKVYV